MSSPSLNEKQMELLSLLAAAAGVTGEEWLSVVYGGNGQLSYRRLSDASYLTADGFGRHDLELLDSKGLIKLIKEPTGCEVRLENRARALLREAKPAPPRDAAKSLSDEVQEVLSLRKLDLNEFRVVGSYYRYSEPERNRLIAVKNRLTSSLLGGSSGLAGFVLWARPGNGKSFLVDQTAEAIADRVSYAKLNLSKLSEAEFTRQIEVALSEQRPTLLLVDEVDAKADAAWPYDVVLGAMEYAGAHAKTFVFVGSGGGTIEGMMAGIRARPKGEDMLDRVPDECRFVIPPPDSAGERLLAFVGSALRQADADDREVTGIEKTALLYLLSTPALATMRQLGRLGQVAAKRLAPQESRLRLEDLFSRDDAAKRDAWAHENWKQVKELQDRFLAIVR